MTEPAAAPSPLSDGELVSRFRDASLPAAAFHHREHVRVAWLYVRRHGMPDAIPRFAEDLRRFAVANGVPGLYHATITWAFLLIVADRCARAPEVATFDAFAAANDDLLRWSPSVLDRWYRKETLASDLARATFLWPDRAE